MKIHTTEALMKAEISRRSLMKTSALGSLALASSAFTLPFSQMVRAAEGSGRRESGLEFLHR
mgnify:CR=1 FL=1